MTQQYIKHIDHSVIFCRMAVHAAPPGKRKEIYKYEAPWTIYSMNWSIRPDKRFRLALGSFVEEYNNKVSEGCCVAVCYVHH